MSVLYILISISNKLTKHGKNTHAQQWFLSLLTRSEKFLVEIKSFTFKTTIKVNATLTFVRYGLGISQKHFA